jgi:hypothetical protein
VAGSRGLACWAVREARVARVGRGARGCCGNGWPRLRRGAGTVGLIGAGAGRLSAGGAGCSPAAGGKSALRSPGCCCAPGRRNSKPRALEVCEACGAAAEEFGSPPGARLRSRGCAPRRSPC